MVIRPKAARKGRRPACPAGPRSGLLVGRFRVVRLLVFFAGGGSRWLLFLGGSAGLFLLFILGSGARRRGLRGAGGRLHLLVDAFVDEVGAFVERQAGAALFGRHPALLG